MCDFALWLNRLIVLIKLCCGRCYPSHPITPLDQSFHLLASGVDGLLSGELDYGVDLTRN